MEDIKETVQENTENKLFYSIGEVAKMFNVNTSLIRYWEKEFAVIKPKKKCERKPSFHKKRHRKLSQNILFGKRKRHDAARCQKSLEKQHRRRRLQL